mgnify:CR=1 FL=1
MHTFRHSRHVAAPPDAIFAAIAQPERLARWWGPDGFTNRFHTFAFQPGGRWVFDMVGPEGTVYPNESVFQDIVPGQQVVIRHVCQPLFTLSITLTASDDGTALVWEQTFDDASVAQAIRHIVEPANEQNLDRLGRELGTHAPANAP